MKKLRIIYPFILLALWLIAGYTLVMYVEHTTEMWYVLAGLTAATFYAIGVIVITNFNDNIY